MYPCHPSHRLARAARRFWLAAALLATGLTGLTGLVGCSATSLAAPGRSAATVAEPAVHEEAVQLAAPGVTLTGQLFTPAAAPRPGEKRPAIVLMHGCGGLLDSRGALAPRHRDWAERFARWGFVTLAIDSFNPRGVRALCEMKDRPLQPWRERTTDAYAALDHLVARADVDPRSVFVLGWSHGGSTVMGVVREQAPGLRAEGPHFKAAVAFYPGCTLPLSQKVYRPTMPLLILHGEADDWTPAAPCVELGARLQAAGLPVQTITYAGAHHGFDQPSGRVHLLPQVYNPRVPGERGAHVGTDPRARALAIDEVQRFMARQGALRAAPIKPAAAGN